MRPLAWLVALGIIAVALGLAVRGAFVGLRAGRAPAVYARLKSPTVYLFSGYLVIAGLVSPRAPGESNSPLYGLAFALPLAWALAAFAASADEKPALPTAALHFLVFGTAVLASGAVVLALTSPGFVPPLLR
jgi:hypothetical protein